MEDEYYNLIEEALGKKEPDLESRVLTDLKDNFKLFFSVYENLYNILLRKALISEDPYKHEDKFKDITNPEDGPFGVSEKQERMSHRLASYHTRLEFINTHYQFNLDFINLTRIKKLTALIQYINWLQLSEASPNVTTQVLAELITKVRRGSDKLSIGIVSDGMKQIATTTTKILAELNEVSAYHKEMYKLAVRRQIYPHLDLDVDFMVVDREKTAKSIKKLFPEKMAGMSYFPELIKQLLEEDFSDMRDELREEVLKRLQIKEKAKKKTKEIALKATLLDGIRMMVRTGSVLQEAIGKISENHTTLESLDMTFFKKLKKLILKALNVEEEPVVYDITVFDAATASNKREKVAINDFITKVQKKSKLYIALTVRTSAAYRRLEAAQEGQIFNFLNKEVGDLNMIQRTLTGLNDYFLNGVDSEYKGKMRGIKINLSSLKNSLVKANQNRHDYVMRHEEAEQMKKLGIDHDED